MKWIVEMTDEWGVSVEADTQEEAEAIARKQAGNTNGDLFVEATPDE